MKQTEAILELQGPHRFLSNFWLCPVMFEYAVYPSAEHAYQAAKTLDPNKRQLILACPSPGAVKRLGKAVPMQPGWDKIKISVMTKIVRDKFTRNADLGARLRATGNREIEEGNWWGDKFWGVCPTGSGDGENHLGKILMQIRGELKP